MQVKKFEAPSMNEALKLVKTELGPDAIILSTKNHRKGFGLLSKASVEITAAVSEKALAKKQYTERVLPEERKEQVSKMRATQQKEVFDRFGDHMTKKKEERQKKQDRKLEDTSPKRYIDIEDETSTQQASGARGFFQSTIGYGRNGKSENAQPQQNYAPNSATRTAPRIMTNMMDESIEAMTPSITSRTEFRSPAHVDRAEPVSARDSVDMAALSEEVQQLKAIIEELKTDQSIVADGRLRELGGNELQVEFQNLLRNGVEKKFASQLIKQASFSLNATEISSSEKIIETLALEMMNNIKIHDPLDLKKEGRNANAEGPVVFTLVGPTGVGKTTTIAKLASQAILHKNLRVGLINLDSYKVAAVDQLGTYAKILNIPFRQASNAVELDRALSEFKPLDLVLVDTSGRSQKDSESLAQMKNLLNEFIAIRPLLILSATTRDTELYDIITRFRIFNPTGLLFSKLDESATFGCVYNVAMRTHLPLTYFTTGQRVPEDIESASKERVASLILDLS